MKWEMFVTFIFLSIESAFLDRLATDLHSIKLESFSECHKVYFSIVIKFDVWNNNHPNSYTINRLNENRLIE